MFNSLLNHQRFLNSFLMVFSFLFVAKLVGFDFGLSLQVLAGFFWLLFIFFVSVETKKRWSVIHPFIQKKTSGVRTKFEERKAYHQQRIDDNTFGSLGTRKSQLISSVFIFLVTVSAIFDTIWHFSINLIRNRKVVLITTLGFIALDILFFKTTTDLVVIFLAGLWILSAGRYHFKGNISVIGGLALLLLCPFLLIFKKVAVAEKSAIWAYVFLLFGFLKIWKEEYEKDREGSHYSINADH